MTSPLPSSVDAIVLGLGAGGAVTIDSQLFAHAEDRRMALVALERMAELLDRPEVRAVVTPIVPLRPMLRRPALLDRFVQHVCGSGYHPSGTAPMGTSAETGAADARGRVFGVEGLWIADASLMPTIPTSNIHIPTLMMAERIAEFARLSIRQA